MEQICVAWMSLKRVALKIYFSIKGANDILCCDPESSFFNAVFRADINDLWERLLTLLLMKLNDGMYAGRETSISFCMILRSLIITSFPMSLDSLTFLNQKNLLLSRTDCNGLSFCIQLALGMILSEWEKKVNLFSMCNSIILYCFGMPRCCVYWQNIMSIVKGEEDRSESINWNVEIKGELTIENCFVIYDTHNMAVVSRAIECCRLASSMRSDLTKNAARALLSFFSIRQDGKCVDYNCIVLYF